MKAMKRIGVCVMVIIFAAGYSAAAQEVEPVKVEEQNIEPVKTPEPVKDAAQNAAPAKDPVQNSEPVKDIQTVESAKDPVQYPEPVKDAVQNAEPAKDEVQKTEPVNNPAQNAEPVQNAEPLRGAVMDFTANNIPATTANAVRNLLEVRLYDTGEFTLIERAMMDEIMKEQELSMTGCIDTSCAVKIGKLLSARVIFTGSVDKLGSVTSITVKMIDVEKGSILSAFSGQVDNDMRIPEAIGTIAKQCAKSAGIDVTGRKKKEDRDMLDTILTGKRMNGLKSMGFSALVPGLGQYLYGGYYGKYEAGVSFSIFSVLAYFTFDAYNKKENSVKAYNNLGTGTPKSEFDNKWQAAESANLRYNIFAVSLVSAYLLNIADAYWSGSRMDAVKDAAITGTYQKTGLSIALFNDTRQNYIGAAYTYTF